MPHGLVLLNHGFVSLRVVVHDGGLTPVVEEELGLVEVFLVAGDEIQFGECHLGNLMAGHHTRLSGIRSDLLAYHIGVADGDVEELAASRCLVVGNGALDHVTEIVELVAQVLFLAPALVTSPLVGLLRVLGARGVEIAVGLLCRCDDVEHGVDILHQFLVRIRLQDVRGSLDGLVRVGVVEGQSADGEYLRGVFQMGCRIREVCVAPRLLTLRESQGNGHLAAGLQALAPERAGSYFHSCERHGIDGVAVRCRLLLLGC